MKKLIIPIISILLLVCTACSNSNNLGDTNTSSQNSSDLSISTTQAVDEKGTNTDTLDTDIEHIYINILGSKSEIDITAEILDYLEMSKTVKEPLADNSVMREIGTIEVLYNGKDSKKEFGKIYFDNYMNVYIQSNENKNNAVLKITDFSSESFSKLNQFDTYKSMYGKSN